MNAKRLGAGVSISLTGIGILVPTGMALFAAGQDTVSRIIAGFGVVIGLLLAAGGGWLAQSDIESDHALRVAGWNLLGVVALGAVLTLVALAPSATLPAFVAAVILGVSAVAHVLIGVNDVRRIRVTELAREREKLAVLNRLTRHNLRNDTQVLMGLADTLRDRVDDPDTVDIVERVRTTAADIAAIDQTLKEFQQAIEHDHSEDTAAELRPLVERVADRHATAHPDADISVDVPDGTTIRADEHLGVALDHLVENAIQYSDTDTPHVEIRARRNDSGVDIQVIDDGPGIPESERRIVTGEQDITQLEHASGLGLWVVKSITESYDGDLAIATDDDGTTVSLHLPGTPA